MTEIDDITVTEASEAQWGPWHQAPDGRYWRSRLTGRAIWSGAIFNTAGGVFASLEEAKDAAARQACYTQGLHPNMPWERAYGRIEEEVEVDWADHMPTD